MMYDQLRMLIQIQMMRDIGIIDYLFSLIFKIYTHVCEHLHFFFLNICVDPSAKKKAKSRLLFQ